ncbi:MAG: S8/S53 family peptidase [Saprospiraceae bacterium]|nr:S8/S53 family peptidase [Saprospiraceae bacterium]
MKRFFPLLCITIVLFSCKDDVVQTTTEPITKSQINSIIDYHLEETGRFDWSMVNIDILWAAIENGDHIVTVGYGDDFAIKPETSTALLTQRENLINLLVANEQLQSAEDLSREDIILYEDDELTHFDLFLKSRKSLDVLSRLDGIRYIEPGNYNYYTDENSPQAVYSSSGCSTSPDNINRNDYVVDAQNAWIPWNFYAHNIPDAWSITSGSGITIGVVDTGISPDQNNFSSQFNSGLSQGRSFTKKGYYVSSWWPWASPDGPNDRCGHGTSMAATAAAPRNSEGVPTGVAYNSNLISVRGTSDVVLNGYNEQRGVANSIKYLAGRNDVKVISMSIGNVFSVGRISDAIQDAYYNDGKLLLAAAGTSTSFTNWYGVIFPAWMSETVAVTGVRDGNGYEECDNCHTGSEVDFTVVMQRDNTSVNSVCLGFAGNTANYIGGSSVATATTAGIAALIWSENPNWSRAQVLQKMKESSDFYPNRNNEFGYGNIDALEAVQ